MEQRWVMGGNGAPADSGDFQGTLENILETHDRRGLVGRNGVIELFDLFGSTTDQFWLWCLTDGIESNDRLKSILPESPDKATQERFTGQSGRQTVEQAMGFKNVCLSELKKLGFLMTDDKRILDFGCGWGRITRVFLNSVRQENLFGVDVLEEAIEICRECRVPAHLSTTASSPPADFPDGYFDVIFSYSVFSHLSEEYFVAWVNDFRRLLRPGGVALLTTRPRDAIGWFKDLRDSGEVPDFARGAASSFVDWEGAYAAYDSGEFCFAPEGSGGEGLTGFYGESCIPQSFVEEKFRTSFEITKMVNFSEHYLFDQNLIVLKK